MAASTMYVTPAGAGTKAGGSWANAMDEAAFEVDIEGGAEAGDIYYVAGGTYTLDSDYLTGRNGGSYSPIKIIGVNSGTTNEPPVLADWATGDNRPLFAAGAWNFLWNACYNWMYYNFRVTTTNAVGFLPALYSISYNVSVNNSSGTSSRTAFYSGSAVNLAVCECVSTNGYGIFTNGGSTHYVCCYIHDSFAGIIETTSNFNILLNSIIDTCSTGTSLSSTIGKVYMNNVFYGCTVGIVSSSTNGSLFINNIFDGNTKGVVWNTTTNYNLWNFNCWDNTTDVTNVTKGLSDITGDPAMTNPASADFSLQDGSNCLDTGLDVGDFTSATT
jgi:hypothetical protein